MKTTYKKFGQADIPMIVSMMRDFYAIDGYAIDTEKSAQLFDDFISRESLGTAWLILSDGVIAGYAIVTYIFSFEFFGLVAFVDELYIKEEFRRRAIGKTTIEFLKADAVSNGIKRLYLEVEKHNEVAQSLYRSAGFTTHNRMFMQYKIN